MARADVSSVDVNAADDLHLWAVVLLVMVTVAAVLGLLVSAVWLDGIKYAAGPMTYSSLLRQARLLCVNMPNGTRIATTHGVVTCVHGTPQLDEMHMEKGVSMATPRDLHERAFIEKEKELAFALASARDNITLLQRERDTLVTELGWARGNITALELEQQQCDYPIGAIFERLIRLYMLPTEFILRMVACLFAGGAPSVCHI
jgi:hypothetical protein